MSIDCSGLLEGSTIWREFVKIETEDKTPEVVESCNYDKNNMAVAVGTIITIVTDKESKDGESNSNSIELDNVIQKMCWGTDGTCLIAGDECGTLHFITAIGQLLFSHRVTASKKYFYLHRHLYIRAV